MRNNLEYIYNKLSLKYNIPEEAIIQMVLDTWKGIKKEMVKRTGKDILLANFGSIYYDTQKIYKRNKSLKDIVEANERKLKEGKVTWEKYLQNWIEYNRVINNQKSLIENIDRRYKRKKGERGL